MSAAAEQGSGRASPRAWMLRIGMALALPVLLVLGLEAGLRLFGYGRPATFLIADAKPGYLRTNPDYASLFLPGNFDLRPLNFRVRERKPANTLRVVVLGESAAQGVPVPSFGFAAQLRAQLRVLYPGKEVEVLNTGIVSVNSHVVYQVAREMARLGPDLYVVYMGNNEVVGPYGPGCAYLSQMPPLWVLRSSVFVRSTRLGQLMGSLVGRMLARGGTPAEWGGMSMFVNNAVAGDDPRLGAVYSNFEANVRGILDAASGAGAKTVLCTVVANLKDCAPFLSLHRPGLSAQELAEFGEAFTGGEIAWRLGDDRRAGALLRDALRIDPEYADASFLLGSAELRSGDEAAARGHLLEALHWDALRFRPDPRINQIIREAASGRSGVVLVDCASALGADPSSSSPPSGRELLFEHVHLDWAGNFRVARMMALGCAGVIPGASGPAALMDSPACAQALAYTPHERLPMLLGIDVLVRRPPFTRQLTYPQDQARLAREVEAARRARSNPEALARASQVASRALAADPENPALSGILEGIDLELGDAQGALSLAQRARSLLPEAPALDADEASVLMRLGRLGDAGDILMGAASRGADLDLLAPVLVDYWTRAGKVAEGEAFLARADPRGQDIRLGLALAGLMQASGDRPRAERELRNILARRPSSAEALESLVALLGDEGRTAEADRESLAASPVQPGNQANDLRASRVLESQGDEPGSVRCLEAAETSGPVNATFELTVALKLFKLRRMGEMMGHLAVARQLSVDEGSASVTASIDKLIARMRAEAGAGAP